MVNAALKNQEKVLQYYDREIFNTLYTISNSQMIEDIYNNFVYTDDIIDHARTVDYLKSISSNSDVIESIFIFNKTYDYVISSESKYSFQSFFNYHYKSDNIINKDIINRISDIEWLEYTYLGEFTSSLSICTFFGGEVNPASVFAGLRTVCAKNSMD